MLILLATLALAGPADLRQDRVDGLALLDAGERPDELRPKNGRLLERRYVDSEGRLFARAEVFDLLEHADPMHMGRFWHKRRRSHNWVLGMVIIPPPWSLGAVSAHLKWRERAKDELQRALDVYNTGLGEM